MKSSAFPRQVFTAAATRRACLLTAGIALGTAVAALPGAAHAGAPAGPRFSILYNFTDNSFPDATLLRDKAGNLYGGTEGGGTMGVGRVFELPKLPKHSGLTILHEFNGTDGFGLGSGVIRDASGNTFGNATQGGQPDLGVTYEISAAGAFTILHTFTGGSDGNYPLGSLLMDKAGNLFGTTAAGGTGSVGTIFEISAMGVETVLHNFAGPDGSGPVAGLIRDRAGNLYGTTQGGGASNLGTVFKLSHTGIFSTLHSFSGIDGQGPSSGLLFGSAGALIGTTILGGANSVGTVFSLASDGSVTVLHNFLAGLDGGVPKGLVANKAGTLFGVAQQYGPNGNGSGTVYSLTAGGVFTVLHAFTSSEGTSQAGLAIDGAGNLYGVGYGSAGYIFKIKP